MAYTRAKLRDTFVYYQFCSVAANEPENRTILFFGRMSFSYLKKTLINSTKSPNANMKNVLDQQARQWES